MRKPPKNASAEAPTGLAEASLLASKLLALLVAGMMLFALFAGIETRLFSEGIMLLVGLFGIIGLGALSFYGVNTYLNQCFVGAHPLEEHLLGALFDDQGDGSWEDVP